jgi:hypothetical protein
MLRANAHRRSVVSGDVPGSGMTSTTFDCQTGWWKCSAAKRSSRPVAAAYVEGSSVEVLVVKIVRGGQSALNCPRMRPFRAGSSGTDSLRMSASAAATAASDVQVTRPSARSRVPASTMPAATTSSVYARRRPAPASRAAGSTSYTATS